MEITLTLTGRTRKPSLKRTLSKFILLLGAALVCSLFLASCSSMIVADPAPAPIDMGELRAETTVCGHHAVGGNICWISAGNATKDVSITIATYLRGQVILKSDAASCSLTESFSYQKSQPVTFNLGKYISQIQDVCVISVLVQPELPGDKKDGIEVEGQSGEIVVQVTKVPPAKLTGNALASGVEDDGNIYPGSVLFATARVDSPQTGGVSDFVIDTEGSMNGKIRIDGCGISQPYLVSYSTPTVPISVRDVLGEAIEFQQTCQLYGRVVRADKQDDRSFLIEVNVYSDKAVPLEDPVIKADGDEVQFFNDGPVSYSLVEDQVINKGSGKVFVKDPMFVQLRQITAVGRTKIVEISNGKVIWAR